MQCLLIKFPYEQDVLKLCIYIYISFKYCCVYLINDNLYVCMFHAGFFSEVGMCFWDTDFAA